MGFWDLLLGKKEEVSSKKEDSLSFIFKNAERGMYKMNYPVSKEGQFELLMFDIWLGIFLTEDDTTYINYAQRRERIEEYLKQMSLKLGFPPEKKYERKYTSNRENGWKQDVIGLVHSDYPRTKQYLPGYLYLCIVEEPLIEFSDEHARKKIDEIPYDNLIEFTKSFCEHYSWYVKTITEK